MPTPIKRLKLIHVFSESQKPHFAWTDEEFVFRVFMVRPSFLFDLYHFPESQLNSVDMREVWFTRHFRSLANVVSTQLNEGFQVLLTEKTTIKRWPQHTLKQPYRATTLLDHLAV